MYGYTLVRIAPLTSRAYGNFNPGVGMLPSCVKRKFSLKSARLPSISPIGNAVECSYFLGFYKLLSSTRIDKALHSRPFCEKLED